MSRMLFLFLNAMLLLSSIACTYEKQMDVNPEADCLSIIPDTISFSDQILPVLNADCNVSGCHSGNIPAGGLNLEASKAYAQLSKKGSGYIDTVNPARSVLYSSLTSQSNPMPPAGKLSECTIELIAQWMKQKGKNN